MRVLLPLVITIAFVSVVGQPRPTPPEILIDKYLTAKTQLGRFSGAVLVAKDDKILLRKSYGFANVEKKIPFRPDTVFHAASVTKMFTAMAMLRLRDAGKLNLSDPVCKFLESCPDAWKPVTIEQVLHHRSGIPDYEEPLDLGSPAYFEFMSKTDIPSRVIAGAAAKPLDFDPGSKFRYSNTGYIILARIVEKASGRPYAEYLETEILRPAGMKTSGLLRSGKYPAGLATGYTHASVPWDKFLPGVSLNDGHLKKVGDIAFSGSEGDAALFTTIDDLFRWSRIMDGGGKLVSNALANEVFDPKRDNYGYGWFVLEEFGRRKLWHNGQLPGFVTDFIKFPSDALTIILVTNIDRSRLSVTTRDVSRMALGLPTDMPIKGDLYKLSATDISALEGDYKTSDGKTLKVKNEPDYFTGYMNDAAGKMEFIAGWIPISPTEFYFPMKDGHVRFSLGKDGKASEVLMRWAGENHIAVRVPK